MSVAFKIWRPHHADDGPSSSGLLSRSLTLTQFFRAWHVPIIMEAERENAAATIAEVEKSLEYWERLTGSPTLAQIEADGDVLAARFQTGLRTTTWQGRGRFTPAKPLSPATIHKHTRQVRAVLYRTGPQTDPARTAKHLIDRVPYLRLKKPRCKPRGHMTLAEVERLFQAAPLMTSPGQWAVKPPKRKAKQTDDRRGITERWRAFVLVLFYTGLRIGALLQLERNMLTRTRDGYRLSVPEELDKVDKPLDCYLRREAAEALLAIPGEGRWFFDDQATVAADVLDVDTLDKRHRRFQRVAGLEREFGFHEWRRTFTHFYGLAGGPEAARRAQQALNHSDERTTLESYLNITPDVVRAMPPIRDRRDDDRRQTVLF